MTGRTRYREQKRIFRSSLLVLQVEVECERFVCHGPMVDVEEYIKWRDATVEDLSEITSFK